MGLGIDLREHGNEFWRLPLPNPASYDYDMQPWLIREAEEQEGLLAWSIVDTVGKDPIEVVFATPGFTKRVSQLLCSQGHSSEILGIQGTRLLVHPKNCPAPVSV